MNKFEILYLKVVNGNICCTLETKLGIGCNECPYAGVDNCKSALATDERKLRNIMEKLDELSLRMMK